MSVDELLKSEPGVDFPRLAHRGSARRGEAQGVVGVPIRRATSKSGAFREAAKAGEDASRRVEHASDEKPILDPEKRGFNLAGLIRAKCSGLLGTLLLNQLAPGRLRPSRDSKRHERNQP